MFDATKTLNLEPHPNCITNFILKITDVSIFVLGWILATPGEFDCWGGHLPSDQATRDQNKNILKKLIKIFSTD